MKKIFFLLFALYCYVAATAQTTEKPDTSLHATAIAVCDCLTKAKITDNSTEEQVQQAFLSCIFSSAPDFVSKIMSSGDDVNKASEELGTQLAMEMLKNGCPAFAKIAGSLAMGGGGDLNLDESSKPDVETQSIEGIVTKIEERDFTYITIKTTAGRELLFIYYGYVPGSDEWIKDAATKLKNKTVNVSYTETEVYQPKFKQFMNVKEIKTLSIK
jgi:hypothetical protein